MTRLVRLFLMLVAANAVIGSAVLVTGRMDGAGGRVFLTSILVTLTTVVISACSTGWRTPRRRPIAVAGVAATILALGLAEAMLWWSIDGAWVGKLLGTALIVAVAAAGTCLLGLASLAPRHRWTFVLTQVLTAVVVAMAVVAIWSEVSSDLYLRVLGVLCVALAALALVIPVLRRVYRGETRGIVTARPAYCPCCGGATQAPSGAEARCQVCGARYVVTVIEDGSRQPIPAGPAGTTAVT